MKYLLIICFLLGGCAINVPVPGPTPVTTPVSIAVFNQSTVVTDAQVAQAVSDIQTQLVRDFVPAWALPTSLTFYPSGAPMASATWNVYLRDMTDHPGALGYHVPGTIPTAYVFAQTAGDIWTVTLSHEIIEMRVDPGLNGTLETLTAKINGVSDLITIEPCDPVEPSAYTINMTPVADFVFPSWFSSTGQAPFDQLGLVTAPFQVAPGGSLP